MTISNQESLAESSLLTPSKPSLQPSSGLALLIISIVALGPLSTDLYLPSWPTMAKFFATDAARVQLTLSVYLAGFAVAQIFYGSLSDRFGRKPVLLFGLTVYLLASLACVFAPTINSLIVGRFFQAVGACAGPVLGRAIVRDVYDPLDAARVLAYISGAMAIAPMVGPILGGWLTVFFGWQANFVFLSLYAGLLVVTMMLMLAESNTHRDPLATQPMRMIANFRSLLSSRHYLGYLLCFSFAYAALFSFISGSSFVLIDQYGLSPQWYGASFGFVVIGYILGTFITTKWTAKLGIPRMVFLGALLASASGLLMLLLVILQVNSLWAILLPMFLYLVSAGLVMPNCMAGALAPYAKMAGAASALLGFVQMGAASIVGIIVAQAYSGSAVPMVVSIALCSSGVLVSYVFLVRRAVNCKTI